MPHPTRWLHIPFLVAMLANGACSAPLRLPTPYQFYDPICKMEDCGWPNTMGGYQDMQLQDDVFQVAFSANANTTPNAVEQYLLYRCAELAIQNDFDYFTIVRRGDQTTHTASAWAAGYSVYGETRTFPGQNVLVRMGRGPTPSGLEVYDAKQLRRSIEPYLIRPADREDWGK